MFEAPKVRPHFSIVAPAYKTAAYLPSFISSVRTQDYSDWELIIVDDGSPDGTAELLQRAAREESRIIPVISEENVGTHNARALGVSQSRGIYTILFDSDDEMCPGTLRLLDKELESRPVDMLHFGTMLSDSHSSMSLKSRDDLLALVNSEHKSLVGPKAILDSSFLLGEDNLNRQDWGILRRVCKTELLQEAFRLMTNERLVYGEDAYELLVVGSLTREEHFRNDIVTYRYCLGRGITAQKRLSVQEFIARVEGWMRLVGAAKEYASAYGSLDLSPYIQTLDSYHFMAVMGKWLTDVSDECKEEAARETAKLVGNARVATELCRLARDKAYEDWANGSDFNIGAPYLSWLALAGELCGNNLSDEAGRHYHDQAWGHIDDLKRRSEEMRRLIADNDYDKARSTVCTSGHMVNHAGVVSHIMRKLFNKFHRDGVIK